MAAKQLRFAVFGNIYQARKSAGIQSILSCLRHHGADICMERMFHAFLSDSGNKGLDDVKVFDGNDFDADFVLSMGGDGTLLKSAAGVGDKNIPVVGVNMGHLGFLANVGAGDINKALDDICAGRYEIDEHAVIQLSAGGTPFGGCSFAMNDISILKRDNASMITIHTWINDEYIVTYRADGLIVTTPTGSTAYSLSNGGPIITPGTGILCLTPVAPHSLNIRPIVIPDNAVIRLEVESRSHNFLIAADGRSADCREGVQLEIRKAPYTIKTVKLVGHTYASTLREKMMWGVDTRK